MASNPTQRQLQIAKRRKVRALEFQRDTAILARDANAEKARNLSAQIKAARG